MMELWDKIADDSPFTLRDHICIRPSLYIGHLGDGATYESGLYVMLKNILNNSVDEFRLNGKNRIEVAIDEGRVASIRDYGRGIPLEKLAYYACKSNWYEKKDSEGFKKSIDPNGLGLKIVNALSQRFELQSFQDGNTRKVIFERGMLISDITEKAQVDDGTLVSFEPDIQFFGNYRFHKDIVQNILYHIAYMNVGLRIDFMGQHICSNHGVKDLLEARLTSDTLYPIIHLTGKDIEIAFTHVDEYDDIYYSFVNGHETPSGGTHLEAFKYYITRTIHFFYDRFKPADVFPGIVAAVSIQIQDPVFDSQTKIKLGSTLMAPDGISIKKYIGDFIKEEVYHYLYSHADTAEALERKMIKNRRWRKGVI
jgi:topoisomerase-4 subunit B